MGFSFLTLEQIKERLTKYGFTYLEGEYKGIHKSRLKVSCRCGNPFIISLINLDGKHTGCRACCLRQNGKDHRYTLDEVRSIFAQYGCELITENYEGCYQKLKFKCKCGTLSEKTLTQIMSSQIGCRSCACRRMSEKALKRCLMVPRKTKEEKQEKVRVRLRERRKDDVEFRIVTTLRNRVKSVLRKNMTKPSDFSLNLIGCSPRKLKEHLESLFQPGMTWNNYGFRGWHIDHILPCASFDLTKPEEQNKCFYYTNLQPLWAKDNLKKSSTLPDGRFIRRLKSLDKSV